MKVLPNNSIPINSNKNSLSYFPETEKLKKISLSTIGLDRSNKHKNIMRQLSHNKSWQINSEMTINKPIIIRKLSMNHSIHLQDEGEIEINDLGEIKRLKLLFLIYSNHEKTINSQKFVKLLSDSKLINTTNLTKQIVDILFHKETRSKNAFMSFENFCNALISIVKILYPEEQNERKGLLKIFARNLFPLLFNMTSNPHKDYYDKKLELLQFDKRIVSFIEKNFYLFIRVYEKYYAWEFSNIYNSRKSELSEKSYLSFLKDFEICPALVPKNRVLEIYENLNLHKKLIMKIFLDKDFPINIGSSFTIYNFIVNLFIISLTCYNDDNEGVSNDFKCFKLLVDKLYTCPPIKNILTIRQSLDFKSLNRGISPKMVKPNTLKKRSISVEHLFSTISQELNNNSTNNFNNKSMSLSELNIVEDNEINANNILNNTHFDELDLDRRFLGKYKKILIQVYKYYTNLADGSNYIMLNFTAFLRLMKEMGIVEKLDDSETLNFNINDTLDKKNTTIKKSNSSSNFKSSTLISYNELNLLFSKFSSENEEFKNGNKNKINYQYYKKNLSSLKFKNDRHFEKLKANTNKKINFLEFIKIIICIANKILNPSLKKSSSFIKISQTFNLNSLLDIDTKQMHSYLDRFMIQYYLPVYNEIKNQIETKEDEIKILKKTFQDQNFQFFTNKFKPIFQKFFDIYSDGRGYIFQEEFFKFCLDFDIFPQIVQKNRIYFLFIHCVENLENLICNGNKNIFIDFTNYMSILLFISIDSKSDGNKNYTFAEKILIFFQRLNHSEGLKKCVILSGKGQLQSDFFNTLLEIQSLIEANKESSLNKYKKNNSFKEVVLTHK